MNNTIIKVNPVKLNRLRSTAGYKRCRVTSRPYRLMKTSSKKLKSHDLYTAVSTKVVQKKRKSVRDNSERYFGEYQINFDKSSESILPAISSLRCTVEALSILPAISSHRCTIEALFILPAISNLRCTVEAK